jgi:cystathionine beta-lyase
MHDLTRCVQHPEVSHEGFRSLTVPTYRASTITYTDGESFAARSRRGFDGYTYGLHGTPTTRTLEAQMTALHGGVRTVLVPSGQMAVMLVFLTFLAPGDCVLVPDNVYSGVRGACRDYLASRGIEYTFYDPLIGAGIADLIDDRTKLVWVESPGSGTMEVQDVPAIARAAKTRGVLVGCDNTWCTPLLFKPLEHGCDFAAEALTKYVGGAAGPRCGCLPGRGLARPPRDRDDGRPSPPCRPRFRELRPTPAGPPGGGARAASLPALLPRPRVLGAGRQGLGRRVQHRPQAGRGGRA